MASSVFSDLQQVLTLIVRGARRNFNVQKQHGEQFGNRSARPRDAFRTHTHFREVTVCLEQVACPLPNPATVTRLGLGTYSISWRIATKARNYCGCGW